MKNVLRIGTRGSALALWQANWVADKLRAIATVELVIIKTSGDLRQDVPLAEVAGKGVFVKEIEAALFASTIDLAVHSAKDLPSTDTPGLILAAFCERADVRDAVVSPFGTLAELPPGSRVATSAPRRIAQLRHFRPDLRFTAIRGNVDTRLRKLEAGDADALILACAGLDRLGRSDVITERLPVTVSLPQVGQGCVAVQCRDDDPALKELLIMACDHAETRAAVTMERAFLALLGGGCTAPVAAYATVRGNSVSEFKRFPEGIADQKESPVITLTARVASPDGVQLRETVQTGSASATLARAAYEHLLAQGADELLSAI